MAKHPGNRSGRRGRPPSHVRTEVTIKQVEAMASYGVPRDHVAAILGICTKTLRKHYGDVLAIATSKANSLVAQSLFNRAVKGDGPSAVTAAIFWLKTRARWRERDVHEITGPGGGPIQTVDLTKLSDAQLLALEPVLASLVEQSITDGESSRPTEPEFDYAD